MASQVDIRTIFDAVDEDYSGAIDTHELQKALGKGGFVLSLASTSQLIRLHDLNCDNKINFQEFCGLHQFLTEAQSAFILAAGSPTATQIGREQLRGALAELGKTMSSLHSRLRNVWF